MVAAGAGTRFGGPKQYALVSGRTVLELSVTAARSVCQGIVLVVPPGDEAVPEVAAAGADRVIAGGPTRSASVRCGLEVVPDDTGVVVVHDAARPLAGPALFRAVVAAVVDGADGALCGVAVTDTVVQVAGEEVQATLERQGLVAVQTPQAFLASALRRVHASAPEATDDASLVQADGGRVVTVAGDPHNIKLTYAGDLDMVAFLARGEEG